MNGGTGGVLQLPESNITDEEIHALAALLRNNTSIDELNLRGNNNEYIMYIWFVFFSKPDVCIAWIGNSITDDGARALGAVLAGRSGLRLVDLRGNKIGMQKWCFESFSVNFDFIVRIQNCRQGSDPHIGRSSRAIGESAPCVCACGGQDRSSRQCWPLGQSPSSGRDWYAQSHSQQAVFYITVHAFYFVRADEGDESSTKASTVETVCVVDIRDNTPESTSFPYELDKVSIVPVYCIRCYVVWR